MHLTLLQETSIYCARSTTSKEASVLETDPWDIPAQAWETYQLCATLSRAVSVHSTVNDEWCSQWLKDDQKKYFLDASLWNIQWTYDWKTALLSKPKSFSSLACDGENACRESWRTRWKKGRFWKLFWAQSALKHFWLWSSISARPALGSIREQDCQPRFVPYEVDTS